MSNKCKVHKVVKSSYHNKFVEHIKDLLQKHIDLSVRRMFSGFGLYNKQIIFGFINNNELYLKATEDTSKFFQEIGSHPFTYNRSGKQVKISYWQIPGDILENQELLNKLLNVACNSALIARKEKKIN